MGTKSPRGSKDSTQSNNPINRILVDTRRPSLAGVDLVIGKGELVGVCGSVGGGKTTLLLGILGQLEVRSSRLQFRHGFCQSVTLLRCNCRSFSPSLLPFLAFSPFASCFLQWSYSSVLLSAAFVVIIVVLSCCVACSSLLLPVSHGYLARFLLFFRLRVLHLYIYLFLRFFLRSLVLFLLFTLTPTFPFSRLLRPHPPFIVSNFPAPPSDISVRSPDGRHDRG